MEKKRKPQPTMITLKHSSIDDLVKEINVHLGLGYKTHGEVFTVKEYEDSIIFDIPTEVIKHVQLMVKEPEVVYNVTHLSYGNRKREDIEKMMNLGFTELLKYRSAEGTDVVFLIKKRYKGEEQEWI